MNEARKLRLQRIAARAVPQADQPAGSPAALLTPAAKLRLARDAAYERAWAAEIMGLTEPLPSPSPRIVDIQRVTARLIGVPFDQLLAPGRERKVCEARHAAMYLARKLTLKSFGEIARVFGDRDHTAALYGVRRIETKLQHGGELATTIAKIRFELEDVGE